MVYLTCGLEVQGHKGQGQRSPGSRSRSWVKGQGHMCKQNLILMTLHSAFSCVTYRLKATNIKVKDHIGQGQIRIPIPKERQVGSEQLQVASFYPNSWSGCSIQVWCVLLLVLVCL